MNYDTNLNWNQPDKWENWQLKLWSLTEQGFPSVFCREKLPQEQPKGEGAGVLGYLAPM